MYGVCKGGVERRVRGGGEREGEKERGGGGGGGGTKDVGEVYMQTSTYT